MRKAGNYAANNDLYVEKLEEMPKNQWNHLLWDFINPYHPFQVEILLKKIN